MQRPLPIDNNHRVTADDGTVIAYSVSGEGPALVLTNGLTTSSFFWKYLRTGWIAHHRVITWDLPGHGRSGPARSSLSATIAGQPALLAKVMAAAGVTQATQIGWSVGCQVVLEVYRQRPELCNALITLFGPAEHALRNTALPVPGSWLEALLGHSRGTYFAMLVQRLAQAATLPGAAAVLRKTGIIGEDTSTADLRQLINDLGAVHSSTGRRMAVSAEAHSAWDVLGAVHVPYLIMAGDRDAFAPPRRVAMRMHGASPGSELVRLPRATHTALLDHADQIAVVIDDFIRRRVANAQIAP